MIRRPAPGLFYASTAATRWTRTIVMLAGGDQAGPCRSHWRRAVAALAAAVATGTQAPAPAAPAL